MLGAGLARTMRVLACVALACALPASFRAAAGAPAAPTGSPYLEGSHLALAQRVNGAQSTAYRQVLAEFDAWLKRRPDDAVAAVERCRFIEEFAGGEDGGGVEGAEQDAAQCREALGGGPLAATAPVKLFLLERDYGKDAAAHAEALLPQALHWTGPQRAQLYGILAARLQRLDPLKAGQYALQAVEFDPASSQRLGAADYLSRIGAHPRAVAMIEGMPPQQWQNWTLRSGIDRLIAMNEAGAALRLSRVRPDLKLDTAIRIKLARALLDAGDEAASRALMKVLLDEPAPKNSYGSAQELELFEFQRDHGDRADAIAAYRKLRDKGAAADPYARYRLSLSWRYPDAPWQAEDWHGVGMLLLYLCIFALLPLFLVVPLHYRGAVLQARGVVLPAAQPAWPWGLGRLWYVLAVLLAGGGLGLYLFCYPQFESLLRGAPLRAATPADGDSLAHLALFTQALNLVALLPLLRGVSLPQLFKGQWPVGQSLLAGLGMALLLLLAGAMLVRLQGAAKPGIALGSDTIRALQGIYTLYGAGTLLLSMAVVAPLTEELMFRGVYLRTAARYVPFWLAAAIQALVFIGLHDQPGAYTLLFLLALGGAWLARRSGGLLAPITLHLVNNSVAALAIMGVTRSLNAMP